MKTRLWIARCDTMTDPLIWQEWQILFDDKRIEKILSYRQERGRKEQLCSALLLRMALEAEGLNPDREEIVRTDLGKPYLRSGKLHYNISHAYPYVICVTSLEEVGCDVERHRELKEAFIKRCFLPEELAGRIDIANGTYGTTLDVGWDSFSENGQADRDHYAILLWTLKESLLKKRGCGITVPMTDYAFFFEAETGFYAMEGYKEGPKRCRETFLVFRLGDAFLSLCLDEKSSSESLQASKESVGIHVISFTDETCDLVTFREE